MKALTVVVVLVFITALGLAVWIGPEKLGTWKQARPRNKATEQVTSAPGVGHL